MVRARVRAARGCALVTSKLNVAQQKIGGGRSIEPKNVVRGLFYVRVDETVKIVGITKRSVEVREGELRAGYAGDGIDEAVVVVPRASELVRAPEERAIAPRTVATLPEDIPLGVRRMAATAFLVWLNKLSS